MMFFGNKEIKNLRKAADRIKKAIRDKEKIIVYADADLDGTSSAIILEGSIKNLGGNSPEIYFPDREKEGYGINEKALDFLKKEAPALLISIDCGIGNLKEVDIANKMGFEVIIVDHHEVLDEVPKASIIVDPKQKGDKYPFKEFAATGLAFKLAEELFNNNIPKPLNKSFLELVALATIADMMPQRDENKLLIEEGLMALKETERPGLKVFFKENFSVGDLNIKMTASKIISTLNASGVVDHLTEAYLLLSSSNDETVEILKDSLVKKNEEKHLRIKQVIWEVQERILKDFKSPLVFEGGEDWSLVFLGPAASAICRDFQKPVFLFKKGEDKSRGAVRTPKDLNSVEAMKSCSDLLETFGGHPLASGFTVKNENLEKFKNCLIDYFLSK